jgi:hypothetical protein
MVVKMTSIEKAKVLFEAGFSINLTKDELGHALVERINEILKVARVCDIKLAISPREVDYDEYTETIYCRLNSKSNPEDRRCAWEE